MPRSKIIIKKRKEIRVPGGCPFCRGKINPDYKNVETLNRLISDRGKIVGRDRSGLCPKHQRRLAVEIKRARYLALVPYLSRTSR